MVVCGLFGFGPCFKSSIRTSTPAEPDPKKTLPVTAVFIKVGTLEQPASRLRPMAPFDLSKLSALGSHNSEILGHIIAKCRSTSCDLMDAGSLTVLKPAFPAEMKALNPSSPWHMFTSDVNVSEHRRVQSCVDRTYTVTSFNSHKHLPTLHQQPMRPIYRSHMRKASITVGDFHTITSREYCEIPAVAV